MKYDERENPALAAEDDFNTEKTGEARRAGAVVDLDYRRRMHAALDDLISRVEARRTCAGDRERGRR